MYGKGIKDALENSGVVFIAGPEFSGKTITYCRFAFSSCFLDTKEKIQLIKADLYPF